MQSNFSQKIRKLVSYEFWPYWLFYVPVLPFGLLMALKARSLTYFVAANPGVAYGGLLNASKYGLLKQLDEKFYPKTLYFPAGTSAPDIQRKIEAENMQFPLIAKPDKGERGKMVEKLNHAKDLDAYLSTFRGDLLLQAFIPYPLEAGVLFWKMPLSGEMGISSVVLKEFLQIEGDGKHTLAQLIKGNLRANARRDYLYEKYAAQLASILPKGEKLLLEPIGNHNRGTTFLNGNHLISPQMVSNFAQISQNLAGFCYGRFDVKIATLDDLCTGQHLKIMEINGVNSEPAHIYDPKGKLWKAYQDVAWHVRTICQISRQNKQLGATYPPVRFVFSAILAHLIPQKKTPNPTQL